MPSPMSIAVVGFLANLMPLYSPEKHDEHWCARDLRDGTLICPVDETECDEERGTVLIHWQGDEARESSVDGDQIVTLALERYVRLHGVGATEEAIAAELWHMARHFRVKTGCDVYLPQLAAPAHSIVRAGRTAIRIGEGVLVNLVSKFVGG